MFARSLSRHVLFTGVFCGSTSAAAVWYTTRHRDSVRSNGNRVILPLIAANACVFGLFWVPPAHRVIVVQ